MKPDKEFKELLRYSRLVVKKIAEFLIYLGFKVELPPEWETPNSSLRFEYVDDGDLYIITDHGKYRIEVKYSYDVYFDSVETFKYPDVIIDEPYKIDKKYTYPLIAYIKVNAQGTGFLFIPVTTKKFWYIKKFPDKREKRYINFTCVDKIHTSYHSLIKEENNGREKNT